MTDRELMQQALDALEWCYDVTEWPANGESAQDKAIEALRARLAQPEQEPVAKYSDIISDGGLDPRNKFDTAPPQREWQDLTDDESDEIWGECLGVFDCLRMTQAKLKEKNS